MHATFALLLAALAPQHIHEGNGLGQAFVTTTPARIGDELRLTAGDPDAAGDFVILNVSDGVAPTLVPGVGEVGLSLFSRSFFRMLVAVDDAGEAELGFAVAPNPALIGRPPLFANVMSAAGAGLSVSKTVRIAWENPDGFSPVEPMSVGRGFHTATALHGSARDNRTRVLVAGGGGGEVLTPGSLRTTELFDPVTRAFEPGPDMAVERTLHIGVRLDGGDILIAGGADSGGVATDSAEIFDPAAGAFMPTGSMTTVRLGHAVTLLADGRLFVSGGLASYVDAANDLLNQLNTAQSSAELYDPASGTWAAVAGAMASPRSGHVQTLLPDGRVLITGGISGAVISPFGIPTPTYSNSAEIFDPANSSLVSAGQLLTGLAFHGASVLPSGEVLVSGGTVSDGSFVGIGFTQICQRWDGALTWLGSGSLAEPVAYHTQLAAADDGTALIFGGLAGTFPAFVESSQAGRHDGSAFTSTTPVGQNPGATRRPQPRGNHTVTRLFDGTYLVLGGAGLEALGRADGYVYVE